LVRYSDIILEDPDKNGSFNHGSSSLGQDKKPRRQKHRELVQFNQPQCSLATPHSPNNPNICNIWSSHSGFAEVSSLLWCYVASVGKELPTLRRGVLRRMVKSYRHFEGACCVGW